MWVMLRVVAQFIDLDQEAVTISYRWLNGFKELERGSLLEVKAEDVTR